MATQQQEKPAWLSNYEVQKYGRELTPSNNVVSMPTTQTNTIGSSTPSTTSGMSASAVSANKSVSTPQPSVPSSTTQYSIPAYGSNVANFDPTNPTHIALADAGMEWAQAKARGDTAGMNAAAAKGEQIRATGNMPYSYDAVKGVTTFNNVSTPQAVNAQPTVGINTDPVFYPRSASELQAQSGDSLAIERAALLNAINERMNALRNSAQYSSQLLQDQRVLEDAKTGRALNPFSGRTGYQQAQITRGREIDDTYRAAQLENQLNALQNELYNFDKLSPERQRQIYNELLTLERQFGLNVGQLTGDYGGQRILAGQQFDWQQQMDVVDRTGYIGGTGANNLPVTPFRTLQGQQFDRAVYESDREYEFRTAQQEWENMFRQAQFDENKAARIWEQAFKEKSFQQEVKEAAASRGLQWASLNQRQKEFVADQAFREKQFELEERKFNESLNRTTGLSAKESADNYSEVISNIADLDAARARAYIQSPQIRDALNDSDYKAALRWIDENL